MPQFEQPPLSVEEIRAANHPLPEQNKPEEQPPQEPPLDEYAQAVKDRVCPVGQIAG